MQNSPFKKYISSTVDYHDFSNALNIASELDCGIEISRFGKLRELDEKFEETLTHYKNVLKNFDGNVSLHGFFSNLSIASKDPLIREVSRKRYYQSFELARELGAETVVFHTCYNNLLKHREYQEMFFLANIEFFNELVENFQKEGIVATIENVHENDSTFIRNLVGAINSPFLKATLDVGHVNLHSELSPTQWIKDYGIMLHHMHIHNNFKDEDAHSSLKNGSIDYIETFKTIKEMQLHPSVTFEIFDYEELVESVEYFNKVLDS